MRSVRRMLVGIVASSLVAVVVLPAVAADGTADIVVFSREGCGRCAEAERFLAQLQSEQPGLRVETHDVVREPTAAARLRALLDHRGVKPFLVPSFVIGDDLVIGFRANVSETEIRTRLAAAKGGGSKTATSASPEVRTTP